MVKIYHFIAIIVKFGLLQLSATVIREYVSVDEMARHTDQLLDYLDDSLNTLHDHLHSMDFKLMIKIIWEELCSLLYDLVHTNMQVNHYYYYYTYYYITRFTSLNKIFTYFSF